MSVTARASASRYPICFRRSFCVFSHNCLISLLLSFSNSCCIYFSLFLNWPSFECGHTELAPRIVLRLDHISPCVDSCWLLGFCVPATGIGVAGEIGSVDEGIAFCLNVEEFIFVCLGLCSHLCFAIFAQQFGQKRLRHLMGS